MRQLILAMVITLKLMRFTLMFVTQDDFSNTKKVARVYLL